MIRTVEFIGGPHDGETFKAADDRMEQRVFVRRVLAVPPFPVPYSVQQDLPVEVVTGIYRRCKPFELPIVLRQSCTTRWVSTADGIITYHFYWQGTL